MAARATLIFADGEVSRMGVMTGSSCGIQAWTGKENCLSTNGLSWRISLSTSKALAGQLLVMAIPYGGRLINVAKSVLVTPGMVVVAPLAIGRQLPGNSGVARHAYRRRLMGNVVAS